MLAVAGIGWRQQTANVAAGSREAVDGRMVDVVNLIVGYARAMTMLRQLQNRAINQIVAVESMHTRLMGS